MYITFDLKRIGGLMKNKLIAGLVCLVLATLACVAPSTVTPAPQLPATTSSILFQDDFSRTDGGWTNGSDADTTVEYLNGGMRILIKSPNFVTWSRPHQSLPADVRVEVDATKVAGPDINAFGVICRYQDKDHFYRGYATSDGYVGIVTRENGVSKVISAADGKLHQSSSINQGNALNHVRMDCVGKTLTLYVNGKRAAAAIDTLLTSGGDVGVVAGAEDNAGVDILFNNFVVYQP
jgi:hypothetical protein